MIRYATARLPIYSFPHLLAGEGDAPGAVVDGVARHHVQHLPVQLRGVPQRRAARLHVVEEVLHLSSVVRRGGVGGGGERCVRSIMPLSANRLNKKRTVMVVPSVPAQGWGLASAPGLGGSSFPSA